MRFRMTALVLICSLLIPFAVSAQNPTSTSQKPEANKTQDPLGEPPVMEVKKAPKESPTPQIKSTPIPKPLSINEDPAMIGKRNINKGVIGKMSGSTEKEVAIGRQLAAEIDKQAKFVDDPVITEYVNRVAQNIALHSDVKVPVTVKVIDSDEVNAFALPGGFFYINKGLLIVAENEAELAGVIAHELAHVAARHAVENQTKTTIVQTILMGGGAILGGIPAAVINNTGGIAVLGSYMKFSRSAEEEADRLGVQYMYAAGYDPSAMSTMFEKLEAKNKKKPGLIAGLFMSHPAPADRRAKADALIARFPEREEYVISTSEFQRVQAKMVSMSNVAIKSQMPDSGNDTSGEPTKPTLKRRQPVPDDSSDNPDGQTKPTEEPKPPTMKKRDPPPEPPPTPPDF